MNDTIYGYFKAETSKGNGYVCIRLDRPPKGTSVGEYKYTYSFCSPNDQFCRRIARKIADSRMTSTKPHCVVTFWTKGENFSAKELLVSAYGGIANKPSWLKKAKKVDRHFRSRNKEKASRPIGN